jgi:glucokinase
VFNLERVVLQGDVIALTNAEFELGAGQGSENMLGVAVSTGVGGGLVLNGKLHFGESGNAGYVGHTTVKLEGELCPCGRKGCVEVYSSGPHMVRRAKMLGWSSQNGSFETLAQAAREGDKFALQAIEEGADALAAGIVNAVTVVDINKVVIGGGVSQEGDVFWIPLRKAILQYSEKIGFLHQLDVVPAKLAGEAGVIGAALAVL